MKENKIIEETNNDRYYTVYMHTSPSRKRYIGITSQYPLEKRWGCNGNKYKHNRYFYSAIQKYGFDNFLHEILFSGLSKEEAEQKEVELIALYKSDNRDFGYNIEHGGNSIGKIAEESKVKMIENMPDMSGENNPFYGKCHSDITKEKMRNNHADYTLSNHPKARSIVQYDKDGNFIRLWNCISQITLELGYDASNIVRVCREKQRTAYNFIWRYASEIQDHAAPLFPTSTSPSLLEAV